MVILLSSLLLSCRSDWDAAPGTVEAQRGPSEAPPHRGPTHPIQANPIGGDLDPADGAAPADDVNCIHEATPTPFTGGLLYLHVAQPSSGAYSLDSVNTTVNHTDGRIDWEAGTLDQVSTYIDGYTHVQTTSHWTFSEGTGGDYSGVETSTTTFIDDTSWTRESSLTKTGCTTLILSLDAESGNYTTITSELVSPTERTWESWTEDAAAVTWTFRSYGTENADGDDTNGFYTDDPETAVAPDRWGDCSGNALGQTLCEAWQRGDDGSSSWSIMSWETNGDWFSSYENYPDSSGEPDQWGFREGDFFGAGTTEWTSLVNGQEVSCTGWWEHDGSGAWTCDNGVEGTF